MRKLINIACTALLAMTPLVAGAAERVGDFSLLDENGYFHHMSWYDDHQAIAFLVQANGSSATLDALPEFSQLKSRYESQGIEFFLINPMGLKNRDDVKAEMQEHSIDIRILMDDAQIVSEAMGIDKTGEAFLYNPKTFTIEYRGPVGAQLEKAIMAMRDGEAVTEPVVATSGDPVSYAFTTASVSYEKDVAPIIAENCADCHREGGIAPFAMNSHAMLQGWSPMIREVVMTKRMPPAQVDPHVGDFANDMNIDDAAVQKLVSWIDAGSPKDGASDPLAQLTWPESEWAFGEPDYIINVPEQSIPATGVLDYIRIEVPIDIEEDKWVRGSQYIAGDRTVLHHTINRVVAPDGDRQTRGGSDDVANIGAYIPGAEPRLEPSNTGGLLKKGSKLSLNMHYTTNGKETTDASRIGLWFYPDGVVPEERMSGECACIFTADWNDIPAFDPNFEQSSSVTVERDAYLYGHGAHMHFRGKYMRHYAHYPDGTSELLINIANYSYNWQLSYKYSEPKFIPAGTVLTAVGAFDNSPQNPANPDPSIDVSWGEQSWDEMFFGSSQWKYVDQGGD
ncbi:MAG: redoxin domain-containing protein [Pseudohongiellaceae bacterium]